MDIYEAIQQNDIRSVKTIIHQDPYVIHHGNIYHNTPLHIACRYGHTEIAKILINADVDVNAKDSSGWTPLHMACRYNLSGVAELLIKVGAENNVKDKYGRTPLHFACGLNDASILRLLINAGADVDIKEDGGWTPLHYACLHHNATIIQLLTSAGVNWLSVDKSNQTPVDLAINTQPNDILVFIESISDQLPIVEIKKIRAWRFHQELSKTS